LVFNQSNINNNFMNYLFVNYCNRDFLYRLNEMENKLKDDCQLDIERAAIIARLRLYLEQVNIYTKIKYLFNICYRMRNYFEIFCVKLKIILINACEMIY
jgi:hypothetical protein